MTETHTVTVSGRVRRRWPGPEWVVAVGTDGRGHQERSRKSGTSTKYPGEYWGSRWQGWVDLWELVRESPPKDTSTSSTAG